MKAFVTVEDGSNLNDASPILTCINTLNQTVEWNEYRTRHFKSLSLKQLKQEAGVDGENGFGFAVSLRDGTRLYTSKNMSKHLGFPKNMLDRRCFMSFLNPKDHFTFANHLSQVLNACFIQGNRDDSHLACNAFFCRIRKYHSLKDGYAISDDMTVYKPFRITLHINELLVDDMCIDDLAGTLCVNATATAISSGYSIAEEIPAMTSFTTRHTSSCIISHVDGSAIPYIGYLPQDLIGLSIFDFYHIDDMPQLKDIYELVVKERGSSFRCKPYRFRIHNGCYISLETEWSCFINPFSHKLEFVIGQHRVLKGPTDLDIFNAPKKRDDYFPEEIIKESRKIQKEIINLLTERTYLAQDIRPKRFVSKRKRELLNFVYKSFVFDDEDTNEAKQKFKGISQLGKDDSATSDTDTVVMGDISPFREVSSFASETPPSVQQFRLKENIDRFFASEPKTYSNGSADSNKNEKVSRDDHSQNSSSSGCGSGSGNSGNGSGNTSASKCEQSSPTNSTENYNNNAQQGSSSSKCNFSNFSDSGYGKSFCNSGNNEGQGTSQMGSMNKTMKWQDDLRNESDETFYSCLALTEKSLSAHNRNSHKHLKHQLKGIQANSRENWFQQNDFCRCNKPAQPLRSTVTQTDCLCNGVTNTLMNQQMNSGVTNPLMNQQMNSGVTHPLMNQQMNSDVTNPLMNQQMNSCGLVPTPFYVPLMYMPHCQQHPNSQIQFPFGAPPTNIPNPDQSGEMAGYNSYPNFGNSENLHRPSEEFRAPQTPCKTTMAPNRDFSGSYQNQREEKYNNQNTYYGKMMENFTEAVDSQMQNLKSGSKEHVIQPEQSPTFSFLSRSSSYDKDEDMDGDKENPFVRPNSSKVELTSESDYRYRMIVPNMEDTLQKDREVLKSMAQPEMVNRQLLQLQEEREEENNKCKINYGEENCNITEAIMLGLAMEDCADDELEKREEYLLQLMSED